MDDGKYPEDLRDFTRSYQLKALQDGRYREVKYVDKHSDTDRDRNRTRDRDRDRYGDNNSTRIYDDGFRETRNDPYAHPFPSSQETRPDPYAHPYSPQETRRDPYAGHSPYRAQYEERNWDRENARSKANQEIRSEPYAHPYPPRQESKPTPYVQPPQPPRSPYPHYHYPHPPISYAPPSYPPPPISYVPSTYYYPMPYQNSYYYGNSYYSYGQWNNPAFQRRRQDWLNKEHHPHSNRPKVEPRNEESNTGGSAQQVSSTSCNTDTVIQNPGNVESHHDHDKEKNIITIDPEISAPPQIEKSQEEISVEVMSPPIQLPVEAILQEDRPSPKEMPPELNKNRLPLIKRPVAMVNKKPLLELSSEEGSSDDDTNQQDKQKKNKATHKRKRKDDFDHIYGALSSGSDSDDEKDQDFRPPSKSPQKDSDEYNIGPFRKKTNKSKRRKMSRVTNNPQFMTELFPRATNPADNTTEKQTTNTAGNNTEKQVTNDTPASPQLF